MMGGLGAQAWMRAAPQDFMMGTRRDSGKIMSALFANAPVPGSARRRRPSSADVGIASAGMLCLAGSGWW